MLVEIKNTSLLFIGITISILGTFIIIFDYPQIQFFENLSFEDYNSLDEESKGIHQRLKIEFSIGIGIFGVGLGLLIISFLKRFQNGIRK